MAQRLRPALPMLREVVVVRGEAPGCTAYLDLIEHAQSGPPPEHVDPNAVKLLLYTSGTTGSAKGVLHSHNTIMSEIDAVIGFWRIHDHDVVLMPSPVTHITGYLYALEIAFDAGAGAADGALVAEAVELITRHGAPAFAPPP
jgi:acyl-coenzyme A synthetase/AMP-(fatty) acid ligase